MFKNTSSLPLYCSNKRRLLIIFNAVFSVSVTELKAESVNLQKKF